MVCIQCYLPPILFMIYMKFINPWIAPLVAPTIGRIITYFRGPQAVQSESCPIRPSGSKSKKVETNLGGDTPTKTKDD